MNHISTVANKPPSRRMELWVGLVAAVAGVVAAAAAVVACLGPAAPAHPTSASSSPLSSSSSSVASAGDTSAPAPVDAGFVYLDTTLPVAGQPRVVGLPSAVRGQPGYERAIAVACPSNEAGDQSSEVTYETNNRYARFTATLRPYRSPPDGVRADVFIFQDNADRKPGAPAGVGPTQVRVTMGEVGAISAPIDHAYYLRLRVVCERPNGIVILTDVRLHSP